MANDAYCDQDGDLGLPDTSEMSDADKVEACIEYSESCDKKCWQCAFNVPDLD